MLRGPVSLVEEIVWLLVGKIVLPNTMEQDLPLPHIYRCKDQPLILNTVFAPTSLNDGGPQSSSRKFSRSFSTPKPIDLTRLWIDRFTDAFSLLVGANHLFHALALDFGRCVRIVKNLGVEYEIVLPAPAVPCL